MVKDSQQGRVRQACWFSIISCRRLAGQRGRPVMMATYAEAPLRFVPVWCRLLSASWAVQSGTLLRQIYLCGDDHPPRCTARHMRLRASRRHGTKSSVDRSARNRTGDHAGGLSKIAQRLILIGRRKGTWRQGGLSASAIRARWLICSSFWVASGTRASGWAKQGSGS